MNLLNMHLSRCFALFFFMICKSVVLLAQNPERNGFIVVSKKHPRYFEKVGSGTFLPIGLNLAWPRFVGEKEEMKGLEKMEFYFKQLSKNGGNFARIWLSAPFWEIETAKTGTYDQSKLLRINKLLKLAKKYNIKLKLCLENFRQLTGSPAPFPGSVPFDKPIYANVLPDMTAYLESDLGKQIYISRLRALAQLLDKNPNVFALELWNEMNAVQGRGWEKWTALMLDSVHKLFPNHLVTQSLGSFDDEKYRAMYKDIVSLKGNDFAQVHRYIDNGAKWKITVAPMDVLAAEATNELLDNQDNKPVLVAEIGAVEAKHAGPWRFYSRDTAGVLLHDLLFAPFFSGAAGPGHCWHWDYYIEKNNLWWQFGRFAKAVNGFDPVKEKALPISVATEGGVRFYGLRGKDHALIWLRDTLSNWKSEIVEGIPARMIAGHKMSVGNMKIKAVSFYDPWLDSWTEGKISASEVLLPAFKRSIVVKLKLE